MDTNNKNIQKNKEASNSKFAFLASIFKPITILGGFRRMRKTISMIYTLQENLTQAVPPKQNAELINNHNNLSSEQKQYALTQSKLMHKRSKHALVYLSFALLWLILNILFMRTKLSWWLVLLQVYLCGIFIYYYYMCLYQAANAQAIANEKAILNFKDWFFLQLKKYTKK
jgi:hypothetical protein